MLRQPHVRMIGAECDVEMMVARQAMPADLDQRLAQHAAQRALDHSVVSQQISHEFGSIRPRSEEHTSELQSLMRISYAVFCLKKKKITTNTTHTPTQPHTHQTHITHP